MEKQNDLRLIEAGFPCHQVGAETQRERGASSALPPLYFLHVWWARRPLTPSRAAIVASLDPAGTDPDTFVRQLGIEQVQALVHGEPWTLTGKLLERIETRDGREVLPVDKVVLRALAGEQKFRDENQSLLAQLLANHQELVAEPTMSQWKHQSYDLPVSEVEEGDYLEIRRVAGDPAQANDKIALAKQYGFSFPGDAYGYSRAYSMPLPYKPSEFFVLDPTSGGGSIPFEALRLGHRVIANELNPVATVVLYGTLDFPTRFGPGLSEEIQRYGTRLLQHVNADLNDFYADGQPLPATEYDALLRHLGPQNTGLVDDFNREQIQDYLYTRQVTCPHCGGEAPLLNTCWLSKEAGDPWGVKVIPDKGKVRFETYQIKTARGPNGEDPNAATVYRGTGQCVHCKQAIDGDEIKRQARAAAKHPKPMAERPDGWCDRLYAVVAVRLEPKLDGSGQPLCYTSGTRSGEIKTRKVRYFRPPNQRDLDALDAAQARLSARWADWDAAGLIPTEEIPPGHRRDQRDGLLRYGIDHWLDMFTPRQLLGHLTLVETLNRLKPDILTELGPECGRAVATYLQFAIDKGVDYNSRWTRWITQRGTVSGTFSRHDFSVKWTFGEMIFTGPNSGAAWGLSQVMDAYAGIAELLSRVHEATRHEPPVSILNNTGAYMPEVADKSVDLVCMDPPYYNNVQYAELSDFYYVWQRRTLRDLYPGVYNRRLTDKKAEAVANPYRDKSPAGAKNTYERMMGEIFRECRRTLKDGGIFTLMFTHKSQDAWETLTRSLIEAGWKITASFPVESEFANALNQKDLAAAASSIFIACRKRDESTVSPSIWHSFGGQGVRHDIERAVQTGLEDFAPLKLNPVDEMVASYGKALQVLSSQWPVQDGDEAVSPMRAMNEASRVVAQSRVSRITKGKVQVGDLDSETAMALTIFGIWECAEVAYDDILLLSKSLGIALVNKTSSSGSTGYRVTDREIGLNTEAGGRASKSEQVHAPLVRKGSKLRLALPEQRQPARLANPQTDWDRLHGLIMAYREGDIPVARAYLQEHAAEHSDRIIDLLDVWAAEARHPDRQREARTMLYGLGRQLS
jgi:putative DNA methylase